MAYGIGHQLAPDEQSEAVRQELARVIASPTFKDSDRLVRFLNFVVAETLEGRGAGLKESVIGVEVFDRSAGYDPKIDPIVRVQARRLRAKLETHYAAAGRPGELQIVLLKGGYTPEFLVAPERPVEASPKIETVSKPDGLRKKIIVAVCVVVVAIAAVLFLTRRNAAKPAGSRLLTAYPGFHNLA